MSAITPPILLLPLLSTSPCVGRSVAIVAAYLMYSRHLDTEAALGLIRESRPNIECVLSTQSGARRSLITALR